MYNTIDKLSVFHGCYIGLHPHSHSYSDFCHPHKYWIATDSTKNLHILFILHYCDVAYL